MLTRTAIANRRAAVVLAALLFVTLASATPSFAVSCSGLPAWSSSASYAANASVTFNNHKWTIGWATGASAFTPPEWNWWTDNGVCDGGGGSTPTSTATATRTATPTTGGPTATNTATPTPTATTSGCAAPSTSTWYRVINKNSNKCVDVDNNQTANGTKMQQWTCNTSGAQMFKFIATDSGYYKVSYFNLNSSGWEVSGGPSATGDAVAVKLWDNSGNGTNQQWKPVCETGGYYNFRARHSDKCLDIAGAGAGDGVITQQYTCNTTAAQSFSLQAVTGATPTATPTTGATPTTPPGGGNIGTIVSESQFNSIWPQAQRATTYTYADFVTAANNYYPALCGTGDTNVKKRECAAYFANKDQETGVGRYDRELWCNPPDGNGNGGGYNTTGCGYNCTATDITNGWCGYCAPGNPCAGNNNVVCQSGQQYWGRHSIQLSWNTNYCLGGASIGINLHASPNEIFTNKVTGWRLANWYWMTQLGPAVSNGYGTWPMMSAHDAITATHASGNYGFAGTIRAINGGIECGSRVQQQINRVTYYNGSGGDEEDGNGGVLGILQSAGGTFGRRFCAP
jgi:hypothetical protein